MVIYDCLDTTIDFIVDTLRNFQSKYSTKGVNTNFQIIPTYIKETFDSNKYKILGIFNKNVITLLNSYDPITLCILSSCLSDDDAKIFIKLLTNFIVQNGWVETHFIIEYEKDDSNYMITIRKK